MNPERIYNNEFYEVLFPARISDLSLRGTNDIKIKEGPRFDLSGKSELEQIMNKEWEARKKEADEKGKPLTPGPQFRMSGYEAGIHLTLSLAPSNYKQLVGTNGLNFGSVAFPGQGKELYQRFINEGAREGDPFKYLSGVLAICAAIETSDNYLLIMERAPNLAEYGGAWHTVGGHPNPKHFQPNGQEFNPDKIYTELIDFDHAMADEIKGELGSKREDYDLKFMGLVRNKQSGKPELVFSARMHDKKLYEVLTQDRSERWESVQFFGLKEDEMEHMLDQETNWCPPGKAALEMHMFITQVQYKRSWRALNEPY